MTPALGLLALAVIGLIAVIGCMIWLITERQ